MCSLGRRNEFVPCSFLLSVEPGLLLEHRGKNAAEGRFYDHRTGDEHHF